MSGKRGGGVRVTETQNIQIHDVLLVVTLKY